MSTWSKQVEEELAVIIKDWLKQQGKTQADLGRYLNAESTRMSTLLDVLKKEHLTGGFPRLAEVLCEIESEWSTPKKDNSAESSTNDPFSQLDLLLEKIRDDCES